MSRSVLAVAAALTLAVGGIAVVPVAAAVASPVDRRDGTGVIELTVEVPERTTIPDATPPATGSPTPSASATPTRSPTVTPSPTSTPSSVPTPSPTLTPSPESTVLSPRGETGGDALAATGAGPWLLGAAAALALVTVGAAVHRGARPR